MTGSRLATLIGGRAARGELALGIYLVPGFPSWRSSIEALDTCLALGVDFIEYPVGSAADASPRTGEQIGRALAAAQPYHEPDAAAWLVRAPVRVAVVYRSAWPAPDGWNAPGLLRAGTSGYLFETDPPDLAPYARAATAAGAAVIPAVDVTREGLSAAERGALAAGGGFCYAALGPRTGSRTAAGVDLLRKRAALRAARPELPVCAAFGIKSPADVGELRAASACDGVIIGSEALARLARGAGEFSGWLRDVAAATK
jgi:tryptophan synthase alpha subunit